MNISVWNPNGNNGRGEIRPSVPDSVRFNNLLLAKVNKVDAGLNEYHLKFPGQVNEEVISAFLDDKPMTRRDKGEDFVEFVLKRLSSEYSRNKIGYSRLNQTFNIEIHSIIIPQSYSCYLRPWQLSRRRGKCCRPLPHPQTSITDD